MTPAEFTKNVKDQANPLKAYAYYLTGDKEDANDLLQETFLKAFANYTRFTDDTNIKGWLYTIMRNTFINNYRRKIKRNTYTDSSDNAFYLNSIEHASYNQGSSKLILDDIHGAIDKLPADLKGAFMMNYIGHKYQEIADYYAIPIGTVKTRIHLARQILKKKLKVYSDKFNVNAA